MKESELYGDLNTSTGKVRLDKTNAKDLVIYIDGSKSNTLLELIALVRNVIVDAPINHLLTIYIVSDSDYANNDWEAFAIYLSKLGNPLMIVIRGHFHIPMMILFFKFQKDIHFEENTRFVYDPIKFHQFLRIAWTSSKYNKDMALKIVDRFLSGYWSIENNPQILGIGELELMGFEINKF